MEGTYWKYQSWFDEKRPRTYFWIYCKLIKLDPNNKDRAEFETVALGNYHTHIDFNDWGLISIRCKTQITRGEYLFAVKKGVKKSLDAL